MIASLKDRALLVIAYLGDAAHRRAVVGAGLMLGNHLFGWTDDQTVLVAADTILAFLLSAWSSRTPAIEHPREAA